MTTKYEVKNTKDVESVSEGFTMLPISRTDGKKGKSGLCIIAPVVSESVMTLVVQHEMGKAWIVEQIDGLRSRIASHINKLGNEITSDKIGIDALLAGMKQETESQRMTKDAIGAWFDADLAMLVANRIKEKLAGIADDKVALLVAGYKASFQVLAGRDPSMNLVVKGQLQKALELLPEDYDSVIGFKVTQALDAVGEATETLAAL